MRQKYMLLVVAVIFGLLLAAFAGKAAANSAAFAFTMEKRAVWGNKNKRFYTLDAGELTLSGGLWVVSKNRGASSTPGLVTLEVHKGQGEAKVCTVAVSPSTTFNDKRTFEKSCGRIEGGTYWIFVARSNEDGWHLKGSGSLTTK